jgi:hypothetical protein
MVLARLSTIHYKYENKCVDISKSKFFAEQIEYPGYWIIRQGIQPIGNKIENIKVPKTRKEPRYFKLPVSHQARSSLNGTPSINRPLMYIRKSLELI